MTAAIGIVDSFRKTDFFPRLGTMVMLIMALIFHVVVSVIVVVMTFMIMSFIVVPIACGVDTGLFFVVVFLMGICAGLAARKGNSQQYNYISHLSAFFESTHNGCTRRTCRFRGWSVLHS
jgi:ABC-type transport system involved in cytochrome bd biosynthesis fused ATPase/permease subunit